MNFVRKSCRRNVRHLVAHFLICCLIFNMPLSVVLADVVLTDVVNGNITVNSGGNTTNMTASNGAIGRFSDFDIASTQSVFCAQPSADARALFNVFSVDGTQIYGRFEATGSIYLHDAAGILIGPGAVLNMTQLVATSLALSHEDFLNGRDIFAGGNAAVINQGNISAEKVALIGKKVLNTGTITSPNGYVVLAAGDKVILGQPGSNVIVELASVDVPRAADGALADMADVANEGTIDAQDGMIVLAAGDVFSKALNLGTLAATGGSITVKAARVDQFGIINTDGIEGDGGSVNLTATEVVVLGAGSITTANSGTNGDGGEVVVYSPDIAIFRDGARVEAKGGSESGDGGFFELSGKKYVEVEGQIDLSAANGQDGEFLIDPYNIIIVNKAGNPDEQDGDMLDGQWDPEGNSSMLDIDVLEGYLDSSDVTISTEGNGQGGQAGNVTFAAHRNLRDGAAGDSGNSLTVNADGNINFKRRSGIRFTGGGSVELNTDRTINLNANIEAGSVALNGTVRAYGFGNRIIDAGTGTLTATGDIAKHGPGKLILAGDSGINLGGDVRGYGANNVIFEDTVNANGGGSQSFDAQTGTLTAKGDITKTTSGSLSLKGRRGIDLNGTVNVKKGGLIIKDSFTAAGDLIASGNVDLTNGKGVNGVFDGDGDQLVEAQNGTLTAQGWLRKVTPGNLELRGNTEAGTDAIDLKNTVDVTRGNMYVYAAGGNVQVGGDLTSDEGGVSIIADNGKIYTEDISQGDDKNNTTDAYALNVTIEGYSNQTEGLGVGLPYDDTKKAAIVVMSSEDLKLGPDSGLIAEGQYDSSEVDDRAAIHFLNESASIGGYSREEGKAIDVAIYAASTEGNVVANGGMAVTFPFPSKRSFPELNTGATVVLDAYNTVSFAPEGLVGTFEIPTFSLEVCSRKTEWLKDAVANATLPYADNPEFMRTFLGDDYDYVLRGAGLDNPDIDDGRAWVLEELIVPPPPPPPEPPTPPTPPIDDETPQEPAHLDVTAAFEDRPPFEVEDECPTLMAWAAEELGLEGDIQTYLSGAYVYTTDLQPCEMCARLRDAATILADEGGAQIAALGVVINEFAAPAAPISEEQMASIGQALALHTDDGTHYASAGQWLDALVGYISILNSEIGWSTADSVAFATTKYVAPATAEADAAVVAYIEAQLAGLGG